MRAVLSPFSDPFVNLAIETVLFKHKPVNQHLLFVYFNSPCIVIGRNQNPWLECRLDAPIDILRRRSGGGAVVHSLGNANFCVQSSRLDFSRTRHLDMVCRAFPHLGLQVNERHDLVLPPDNRKVSGSSYKIERDKAYHHATLLLDADLGALSALLRPDPEVQGTVLSSSATDSVRSPVANTRLARNEFVDGIFRAFAEMYGTGVGTGAGPNPQIPNREIAEITDEVREEAAALRSWEWVFGKTPKFEVAWPSGEILEVVKGVVTKGTLRGERMPRAFPRHPRAHAP